MAEDPIKAVCHYAQALKAPRIRESAARLAEQARDGGSLPRLPAFLDGFAHLPWAIGSEELLLLLPFEEACHVSHVGQIRSIAERAAEALWDNNGVPFWDIGVRHILPLRR
jgi:hypothetical protein